MSAVLPSPVSAPDCGTTHATVSLDVGIASRGLGFELSARMGTSGQFQKEILQLTCWLPRWKLC